MFQLSKYHKIVFSEETDSLLSNAIVFSLRTGKGLMIKKGLYELISIGDFEGFPNETMLRLVDFEILVPEDELEEDILFKRANCYDRITLIADFAKETDHYTEAYWESLSRIIDQYELKGVSLIANNFFWDQQEVIAASIVNYRSFAKERKLNFSLNLQVKDKLSEFLNDIDYSFLQQVKALKIIVEESLDVAKLKSIVELQNHLDVQIHRVNEAVISSKYVAQLKAQGLSFTEAFVEESKATNWRSFLAKMATRKKSLIASDISNIKDWNENAILLEEQTLSSFQDQTLSSQCASCEFQYLCGGFVASSTVTCPAYIHHLKQIPVYE